MKCYKCQRTINDTERILEFANGIIICENCHHKPLEFSWGILRTGIFATYLERERMIKMSESGLQVINKFYNRVINGETVLLDNTIENKIIYSAVCDMLQENNKDFVSGDIDPNYPDEQYYIELN